MRRTPGFLFAALLCSLAAPVRAEEDRHALLERGEILTEMKDLAGSDLPEVTMTAVINAPPEKVWDIVSHCANYAKTMVRIKEAHELSRDGDNVRCETIFDAPWPLPNLKAVTNVKQTVAADRWVREWKLESGDYKENTGRWTLTTWAPGRTLVEYRIHSVPNISVPAALQRMGIKSALPKLVEKLREELK
jgi:ribosome-associated toxin RatA of RatAB toxin-antitoxin module